MSWYLVRRKTEILDPVTGVTIPGPDAYSTTQDGEFITRDLDNPATDVRYYLLKETGGNNVVAQFCSLKPPPRAPAGGLEIAITVADGADVADAEVKV